MDSCNNMQILVPFSNFIALMDEKTEKLNSNIFSTKNDDPLMNEKNTFLEIICNIKSINKVMIQEGQVLS